MLEKDLFRKCEEEEVVMPRAAVELLKVGFYDVTFVVFNLSARACVVLFCFLSLLCAWYPPWLPLVEKDMIILCDDGLYRRV